MSTGRLEAFSDGVIAIVITIMVLELHTPERADWASLASLAPVLSAYVLSFVFLGIYWSNHHHMLHAARQVSGAALWANLHLLFWLSLIPFVTRWVGATDVATVPTAVYGIVLLMAAVAYQILFRALVAQDGPDSTLARAVGSDLKGRVSLASYAASVPLAFVNRWIAVALYVFVALLWLVPDRRIEDRLGPREEPA